MTATLQTLRDHLLLLPHGWLALSAGLAMSLETLVFIGLLVPGDIFVLLSGATADSVPYFLLLVAMSTAGSLAGELVGHGIGVRLGRTVRARWVGRRVSPERWAKAEAIVLRGGPAALLAARFIPVVHTLVPLAAGAARKPFTWFLRWSALSSLIWSSCYVTIGVTASASFRQYGPLLGIAPALVPCSTVATVSLVRFVRARRAARPRPQAPAAAHRNPAQPAPTATLLSALTRFTPGRAAVPVKPSTSGLQ